MLDPVIKTIDVPCNQEMAFKLFIEDLASWRPMNKNSVSAMQGEVAETVSVEAKSGGKSLKLPMTEYNITGRLSPTTNYNTLEEFSMDWHIGISSDSATLVNVKFTPLADNLTQVVLTHSNWEAFGEKVTDMRNGYDQG